MWHLLEHLSYEKRLRENCSAWRREAQCLPTAWPYHFHSHIPTLQSEDADSSIHTLCKKSSVFLSGHCWSLSFTQGEVSSIRQLMLQLQKFEDSGSHSCGTLCQLRCTSAFQWITTRTCFYVSAFYLCWPVWLLMCTYSFSSICIWVCIYCTYMFSLTTSWSWGHRAAAALPLPGYGIQQLLPPPTVVHRTIPINWFRKANLLVTLSVVQILPFLWDTERGFSSYCVQVRLLTQVPVTLLGKTFCHGNKQS